MDSNLCEIAVILDRSGSMGSVAADTVGGFNQFVESQKKGPGRCVLTLTQFDSQSIDVVHEAKPIAEVPSLVFEPRGGTPLLDAIGDTITRIGVRLAATPEDKRPGKVICVIITDGGENASNRWTLEKVRELIKQQTEQWKWEFTFLGVGIDAFADAGKLGIRREATANVSHDAHGNKNMYAGIAGATLRSRSGRGNIAYTVGERESMVSKSPTVGNGTGT